MTSWLRNISTHGLMNYYTQSFSISVKIREEEKEMKKIIITFSFLIAFIFTCLSVNAKTNMLHTITLEKNGSGYNILLKTDNTTKVTKKTLADNEIVLDLSGIKSSDTVNALYKGTDNIENLVIESTGKNNLKIYITAKNIRNSSVITQSLNGENRIISEGFPLSKTIWATFVLILFGIIFAVSKKDTEAENRLGIKKDIKDREIALYKQYRRNFEEDMSVNSKNSKMHTMIKKIDRKIDERLSNMSIR